MGCVRETPHKKQSQHGMCKRNSTDLKKEANMGCVRETAHIKTKSVWDV